MSTRLPNIRCWSVTLVLLWIGIVSFPLAAATSCFTSAIHSHAKTSPTSLQLSTLRATHHARSDILTSSRSSDALAWISVMGIRHSVEQRNNIESILQLSRGGGPRANKGKTQKGKGRNNNDDEAQQKHLKLALIRMGIEASLGTLFIFLGESSSLDGESLLNLPVMASGVICMALLLVEITRFLGEDAIKLVSAAAIMTALLFLLQL